MRCTDEVYGSLAYDDVPLLHISLCISTALLVYHQPSLSYQHSEIVYYFGSLCRVTVEKCGS